MAEDGGQSGFGQGRGGNEGMSGAPMWQIKQKMAQYEQQRESLVQELIAQTEEKRRPAEAPNVLVDTGEARAGAAGGKHKPFARTVIVKDLNKVAQLKNIEFPSADLFQNKAPIGLYALFDGQACASAPGPAAAEFCARNFHSKVLDNLAMLRQGAANEAYVKAALIKSFHDIDAEYLAQSPQVQDGCGAAVALLVGDHAFVAVLGRCGAVFADAESGRPRPLPFGVQATAGLGSLGEPGRKLLRGPGAPSSTPEVHGVALKGPDRHPFLLLVASTVASVLDPAQLVEMAEDFQMQPRVVCGEIAARVAEAHAQATEPKHVTLAQVCFLPTREAPGKRRSGPDAQPAAKKAKVGSKEGMQSVRLRHILLKHQDVPQAAKQPAAKGKPVRTRHEAELVLRKALKDLRQNLKDAGKAPKTPVDLVVMSGKKFSELCRELSDCPTAQKGGAMCGDLGWMSLEELSGMGGNFREKVDPLKPGQWGDLVASERGIHLIQRVA